MDEIIDLLAKLDWFETAVTLLRIGTPSHKFIVDRNIDWSGRQIEDMLKSRGVKIWGRGFTHDTLKFRVSKKQARWAEYLLFRCQIPVLSRLVYDRNATYQPVAHRRKAQKKRGVLERLAELMAG